MDFPSTDLGNGYKVVFQRNTTTNQVRAVVKDAGGTIVARGSVVSAASKAEVARSQREAAVLEHCTKNPMYGRKPEPLGDFDEVGYEGDEEGDEEDDEEAEEEDEEYL